MADGDGDEDNTVRQQSINRRGELDEPPVLCSFVLVSLFFTFEESAKFEKQNNESTPKDKKGKNEMKRGGKFPLSVPAG